MRANSRPNPLPAPVTTATLPARSFMVVSSRVRLARQAEAGARNGSGQATEPVTRSGLRLARSVAGGQARREHLVPLWRPVPGLGQGSAGPDPSTGRRGRRIRLRLLLPPLPFLHDRIGGQG